MRTGGSLDVMVQSLALNQNSQQSDTWIEILAAVILQVGCFKRSYDPGCIELRGLFSHRNTRNGDSLRDLPIEAHLIHFKKL